MNKPLLTKGDRPMQGTRTRIVTELRRELAKEGPAIVARMLLAIRTDDPLEIALIQEASNRLSPHATRGD